MGKKLTVFLIFLLTCGILGGCGYEHVEGELIWLYEPQEKIYWVDDGNEPADAYKELRYNHDAGLYYIAYPGKEDTYITNTGEPIRLDDQNADLKNYPLVTSGEEDEDGNLKEYYIYADGSRAFDQEFDHAGDFHDGYAETEFYDGKHFITNVINLNGEVIYEIDTTKKEFQHLKGSIYAVIDTKEDWIKIIDIAYNETLHRIENADGIALAEEGGYTIVKSDDTRYFLDEQFHILYDGKDITKKLGSYIGEWEGQRIYKKGSIYQDQNGKELLSMSNGQAVFYGEGKFLIYDKNRLSCYDIHGERLFTKKFANPIEDMWMIETGYCKGFINGLAVVNLGGEKWGIMNDKGKMMTECTFDCAEIHDDGSIMVSYKQKAGILGVPEEN